MRGHFGKEIFNTFALAYELKMRVADVAQMSPAERTGWLAFLEIKAEEARRPRV